MMLFLLCSVCFLTAGMGLGGAMLLIPALTAWLNMDITQARYLALVAYVPAALGTWLVHRTPVKDIPVKEIVPALTGAVITALCTKNMDVSLLKKFYAGFLILYGANFIRNFFVTNKRNRKIEFSAKKPHKKM